MTHRRFWLDQPPQAVPGPVLITGREAHHLRDVLRLEPGSEVVLLDGEGREYTALVRALGRDSVALDVLEVRSAPGEPGLRLILGMALVKSDRMEWIIQKATELGLSVLAPLSTERCAVRLEGKRGESRTARWREISRQAVKQCRRGRPVEVRDVTGLKDFFDLCRDVDLKIMLYEGANVSSGPGWTEILHGGPRPKTVVVLVGPEGGFSENEAYDARESGFHPMNLGPRILRAETAALAAMAVLGFELGDLSDFS